MASEIEESGMKQTVVVEHFFSPVVEGISLLSSLINPTQHEFAKADHVELMKELSRDSVDFIKQWKQQTDWDLGQIFNFLLTCPYFHEVDIFIEKVSQFSHPQFLFDFFGESIPLHNVESLVGSPSFLDALEDTFWWDTKEKRKFFKEFLSNLDNYKNQIFTLLSETVHSKLFHNSVTERKSLIEQTIQEVRSHSMEPLGLAQFVMGKTFKRTSLYKMYYFIPSYYLTPHRMRIFNSDICIVLYGCAAPLKDNREISAQLELQVKALSDRNRLLILRMLDGHKEYGAKIAEYLGISTATVSHHLEILKKAGFVKEEKVGTIKYFTSITDHSHSVLTEIKSFISPSK